MDKHTFTGVVLIMGLILIWPYVSPLIFPPVEQPVQATSSQQVNGSQVTQDASFSEGISQNSNSAQSTASNVPLPPPRDIIINTPNYKAIISEDGVRLKSLTLKDYNLRPSESKTPDVPVEMVSVADSSDYPMALSLSDERAPRLKQARFTADREQLDLTGDQEGSITFTGEDYNGFQIIRTLTFRADSYKIDHKVQLNNNSQNSYGGAVSMNVGAAAFSKKVSRYNNVAAYVNNSLKTDSVEDATKFFKKYESGLKEAAWVGYMDQYFLAAMIFPNSPEFASSVSNLKLSALDKSKIEANISAAYPLDLRPGESFSFELGYYFGPKSRADLLKAGNNLEKSIDLGWFEFLAYPLYKVLKFLYNIFGNYGIAIIITTLLIKLALWPLTAKSYKSMREMQKLQPMMTKIREKYADDREAMNREIMQLYKTFKINPLGGCLPMFLQIPFFIAFYRVLDYSLELRGAPFMLWINDLSAPDRLFSVDMSIPYIMESPVGIPVLTLLMGASMFWQQKMTPSVGDPAQAKMFMLMPIIFTFILLNMPSGLVLYWLVNNLASIGQQKLGNRPKKVQSK